MTAEPPHHELSMLRRLACWTRADGREEPTEVRVDYATGHGWLGLQKGGDALLFQRGKQLLNKKARRDGLTTDVAISCPRQVASLDPRRQLKLEVLQKVALPNSSLTLDCPESTHRVLVTEKGHKSGLQRLQFGALDIHLRTHLATSWEGVAKIAQFLVPLPRVPLLGQTL
jgi:hypothetical protein